MSIESRIDSKVWYVFFQHLKKVQENHLSMPQIMDTLQISLLVLSDFKRINKLLFSLISLENLYDGLNLYEE